MDKRFERVINLLGQKNLDILQNSCVMVIGLGGVGSFSCEALVRSGIGTIIVVDYDKIDVSNLNRQLETKQSNVGTSKVKATKDRLLEINSKVKVNEKEIKVTSENLNSLFDQQVDYVIDAIDDLPSKIAIWEYCQTNNIKFISSLGMARRIDPSQIEVSTLNKTQNDPMARKLRYMAKQKNLDLHIKVVYSKEMPVSLEDKKVLGSLIFTPGISGLMCADECIKDLINSLV